MTAAPAHLDNSTPTPRFSVLSGVVERITFQNEDNGWTVAKVQPDKGRKDELVTIVGNLPSLAPGESLEMEGFWISNPTYGKQFKIEQYRVLLPATITGIQKYLGSGLIKGVGPKTSEKIVNKFGMETLNILEIQPERLAEVPGLGMKKAEIIRKAWDEQKAIKEVMVFLQGHGISAALAVKIYREYKDASIVVVKNEPYRLARDVFGIGFKTADKIASGMGVAKDDPERLKAGLLYTLSEASDDGHVFLPREELLKNGTELLEAASEQVEQALEALVEEQGVANERIYNLKEIPTLKPDSPALADVDEWERSLHEERAPYVVATPEPQNAEIPLEAIYLPPFRNAEMGISAGVLRLRGATHDRLTSFKSAAFDVVFSYLSDKDGLVLNEKQKEAVQLALTEKVSVLTGGPGTGKTTSMRALLRVLQVKRKKVVLAAPTGRAAKRLSETTGASATTIHRLLELRPGGKAAFDRERPLDADMVIVDEASMLDVLLMNNLLKAVPSGAHLLLVGDTDQLPSVGAGNVLGDIVNSGVVPVVRLDQIFRQGADSAIVTNAHRINSGQMPQVGRDIADFFFFVEDDTEKAADLIVELVSKRIPARFGVNSVRDIQVLAPMHRSRAGVGELNNLLQETLNPASERKRERRWGGRLFREGDKVMQLKNNYEKLVFNGDGGYITLINHEDQFVRVALEDGREVEYDFAELDELSLAYCVSVHKSQGSEYPVVVMPLLTSHYPMLQRNLVYTAITRAKKVVVLVGSKRALAMAIKNDRTGRRYTGLAPRLKDFAPNKQL
ncbi:MAG: ATP-dependent RecD-like DNA helicase [Chloroflexi bacterium]|uniref:ATP-dependent RecD2 DNA helicase n=1 Tax=Candidatus Chlorohelix allophototropha TaxID=3003348 RepID=A0A8T7LZX1_9CHLR|nr:ATP-dependent RecD-like DNA helicase [Chloroflexota bacterium]WJW66881.1 ATP-dependent RecD-like DNA helicase [Chloroflexota bacterium L227-S17]